MCWKSQLGLRNGRSERQPWGGSGGKSKEMEGREEAMREVCWGRLLLSHGHEEEEDGRAGNGGSAAWGGGSKRDLL